MTEKQPTSEVQDLSHELVREGGAIVEHTGTEADKHDMYRLGKVQQMSVGLVRSTAQVTRR